MKYLKLLRPHHWIKNFLLFAAPFFGGVMFRVDNLLMVFPVFIAFSLCASSVYIFNDLIDIERDRLHPRKRLRPIASGSVSKSVAMIFVSVLLILSLSLSISISKPFFGFALVYIIIQVFYTLYLKQIPIIDIFSIAAGFVIRVLAGGAAFNVEVSPWLFLTMFMISVVLATGKRLSETELLEDNASLHRKSLKHYSANTLKEILLIASASSLITYALYTVEQSQGLVYTVPVVTFGLFRYILISQKGFGDATEALIKDRWLTLTVIIWLITVGVVRY
jgi:4-hydroxybenzoate polyprenyltransferase